MEAIEFEARIDERGHIVIPREFERVFGKEARLILLLPEESKSDRPKRQPGSAKGILRILSEDDEHLEDFEAYMP